MAPKQIPGPVGCSALSPSVDVGTMIRARSSCPGVVDSTDVRDALDSALGDGTYAQWQDMLVTLTREMARTERNRAVLRGYDILDTNTRLGWDARDLESIALAYEAEMNRGTSDVDRLNAMHMMMEFSLEIVAHDNDALESAVVMMMLHGYFSNFKSLEPRAKELIKHLEELQRLLHKAKQERAEAWVQTALNVAITAVTACLTPLALLVRGGIFIAQLFLDEALGPPTPDTVDKASKGTSALGTIGEAMGDFKTEGSAAQTVGSDVGKTTKVIGFAFDVNEVLIAYDNVKAVERQMAATKASHKAVLEAIERVKPGLAKFILQFKRWRGNIDEGKRLTYELRKELQELMRSVGI